ncbi:aminoacyl-histidine dipeptidase [Ruminococcus sp. AM30-15AC]|jgi:dipeptidase D|nr:aminoacyl-histidine dipeptidase [uncultured Blautia sp.]RGW20352.1 aminoacyl-histidine dipeptidase [Ruminococcus sp. AF13-37]RGW22382.1 aminoacyl-histidine dipeptidase [Ruminococcus sp. AF13-28]RGY91285.1 aminoacyl-histidine dipeptidase [Ruminococcus sp. AM58-7XD]RHD93919.1 aminoacyl-histidine dipeptidase [Ruminococcus sp. AM30-15AC]RHO91946.1 aminoacyl-histidine dipeptidase [Ruminococcus sp. AF42-9BH]RHP52637.1 aminoacyl-histidine dipeptidase [Ruminococcus sp. AF31-16BH]RHQ98448.1 aminoa
MAVLENCEPKRVFHYFEEICKIPHGSGNTRQISDYLVQFAKNHDLKYIQDEMNNVVIYKPGTAGYENAPTVIVQGHMDMVCEKRPDVDHDFTKDGLNLSVEGDYVSANGTTLGGDDGIAVAYGLALLESDTIAHPPLEVFITVDEEIGLLGAVGFDCSVLKGRRFINLDSEAEGSLWISCAGGLSGISHIPVTRLEAKGEKLTVKISGLMGGHSGAEIDKNRANANSLLGKFLHGLDAKAGYELISVQGGQKDNAITRESIAELLTVKENVEAVKEYAASMQTAWREEYTGTDEGITVTVTEEGEQDAKVLHPTSKEKVVFFLVNVPYGVQKMSGTIKGLVETSTNIGILKTSENEVLGSSSIRSSVETARDALSDKIEYLTEFLGGEYERQGVYPAWEYRKDSPLRDKMVEVYEEMYGQKPNVVAIHAGLECGLFYKKMEGLDCVSLGPDMKDIHTSEEVLSISSTERVWKYLVKVLGALKD